MAMILTRGGKTVFRESHKLQFQVQLLAALLFLCGSATGQTTLHSVTLTVTDSANPGQGQVQYFIYQQGQACSATTQWVAGNRIAGPVTLAVGTAPNTFVFTTPNLGPGDWCWAVSAIFPQNNAGEGPLSPNAGATITGPTPPPPPPPVPVGKPVAPQALAVQVN